MIHPVSSAPIPGPASRRSRPHSGAALVIVLVLVLSMAVIAGAFAYAMKVEARLSVNTQSSPELEWLGRSGIEMAKWVLDQQRRIPNEAGFDSLNQFWAGGPGPIDSVDSPFLGLSLQEIPIGDGMVSVEIIDLERRLNLNTVPEPVLELALQVAGVGAGEASSLTAAIVDWRDRDDLEHLGGGAESSFYRGMNPPYIAKDGAFDDPSELLKVKGVTPEVYWGPRRTGIRPGERPRNRRQPTGLVEADEEGSGLVDIFGAISVGRVNVNTAPLAVLRVLVGGDENLARQLVQKRAGADGVDGTDDDMPFRSMAELPGAGVNAGNLFTVQSSTFEVHVEARIGSARKRFIGILRRGAARDPQVMLFHPE
jgi:general secretion pathway protein K